MIANEQLIAYVSGALQKEERARLEVQLANDETALRSVLEQERLDAALRAMFGGAAEREQVRQAILEVISGTSYQDIKSSVMHEIAAPRFSFFGWLAGWRGGLAAAACAALAFLLWPRAQETPMGFAQLNGVQGGVVVARDGGELGGKNGTALLPGDAIRVGDGAAAVVLFADRTRLALMANTELRLGDEGGQVRSPGFSRSGDVPAKAGTPNREFLLVTGRLAARVAKQPQDKPLTIRTSLATARVVGTEFTLNAGAHATRIEVSEGLVKMAHAGVDSAMEVASGEFALAVPQSELIAGLLPAKEPEEAAGDGDFAAQPFGKNSPWKRPIGSGATYAEVQSPALNLAANGASVRPASHFRPFFVAKPGDPQRRIIARYEGSELATVPVPDEALRGGERPICTLIDPARAVAWELRAARPSGDVIEAMLCVPIQLRGPGGGGNLFSGLPAIAGVIRAGELESGIGHTLSVSVLQAALNRRGPNGGPFVAPARHMPIEEKKLANMGEAGNLHYGTRLALPRGLDLAQLGVGDSGPAFEIARALQTYGAYVTHSFPTAPATDGWKQAHAQFIADLPMETDWPKLDMEISKIVRHLKVVTNNKPERSDGK